MRYRAFPGMPIIQPLRASGRQLVHDSMEISATSSGAPAPATSVQPESSSHHRLSFHDILSVLNPIQYLRVLSTAYWAGTGDVSPESLRVGGSRLISGLLSGPVGLIVNIAVTMAEKVTGMHPEKIVAAQFRSPAEAAAPTDRAAATPDAAEPTPLPFDPQQLGRMAFVRAPRDPWMPAMLTGRMRST